MIKRNRLNLMHTLACLYRGQSLLRIRMNAAFSDFTISGKVLDVGGGRSPDYFSYMKIQDGVDIEALDGSLSGIDFEKDVLPVEDRSIDTLVCANVLEHIYNHRHLLTELERVLSKNGTLIGFVPFWVGYHPDPHDYFRYTKEALYRLLADAGFVEIEITALGVSPVLANFNTMVLSLPRILRPLFYLWCVPFEFLFLRLRPRSRERTPLGFVFTARTHA